MRTTFRVKKEYADIFFQAAEEFQCNSPVKPLRFMEMMKSNQGMLGVMTGYGQDADGLERKNPLIVAIGDSVTAGHFEPLVSMTPEEIQQEMYLAEHNPSALPAPEDRPAIEVTDARECFLDRFRMKLIDKYERTSVSVINSGIAGDNICHMLLRADRDIIRYQPDLVLISASLNWNEEFGTTADYKEILRKLVRKVKENTTAEIILLTSNGDLPNTVFGGENAPLPTTGERAQAIRELAQEEQTCLADVYAVWEKARENGCPWEELLCNNINHPSVEGHEVYAMILMKLFE